MQSISACQLLIIGPDSRSSQPLSIATDLLHISFSHLLGLFPAGVHLMATLGMEFLGHSVNVSLPSAPFFLSQLIVGLCLLCNRGLWICLWWSQIQLLLVFKVANLSAFDYLMFLSSFQFYVQCMFLDL